MNVTIYATVLTGLGIVMTLILTMHNLARTNQQETNRRIDDLRKDLRELLEARFKVVDAQFEVVGVRFQKLEGEVTEVRREVQDLKKSSRLPLEAWRFMGPGEGRHRGDCDSARSGVSEAQ